MHGVVEPPILAGTDEGGHPVGILLGPLISYVTTGRCYGN